VIPVAFKVMKNWDYRAAQRPDIFIANSATTQTRIAEFYNRESVVVYPFFTVPSSSGNWVQAKRHEGDPGIQEITTRSEQNVSTGSMNSTSRPSSSDLAGMTGYFVCLGRIVPYKRFDLAIEACNQLGYKLRIFTNTRNAESERLQKLSWTTIQWIFDASDSEVAEGLAHAQAFIMPQEEDFGIVALEAMSHGTPVIAYWDGGAMETVVHGQTGLFFSEQRTESLVNALLKFSEIEWNPERIIEQSQLFSEERFEREFRQIVSDIL
jgi:glycosyltransferase involved in cell wall biosynthesis